MTYTKKKNRTVVINKFRDRIFGYVYIGRDGKDPKGRGKWGNPFPIQKGVRTREQSVEQYREWINHPDQAELKSRIIPELKGQILGCFCKPYDCHGDVLAEIANSEER